MAPAAGLEEAVAPDDAAVADVMLPEEAALAALCEDATLAALREDATDAREAELADACETELTEENICEL